MSKFYPGMRVLVRDEEWLIKRVENSTLTELYEKKNMSERALSLHCVGISALVKDREAIFNSDIDAPEPIEPASVNLIPDETPSFARSRLFLESCWRRCLPTDNRLHIGPKAVMDPHKYQYRPAWQALNQLRPRILIADAVGLGKTIEAGILMSELIARGRGKRILVVTVKSMMAQFQKEMWERFTIPLRRLDSQAIHKIRAELPSNYNPFYYYDKAIISVDTLKQDIEYRTHLENARWDIIVIDEAHNVADRRRRSYSKRLKAESDKEREERELLERRHMTARAKLAQLLAERSEALIMLSATPHDGRAQSFASLMNMLDPTAIADVDNYRKEDIKNLYVRRFKKDVLAEAGESFPARREKVERCQASPAEERAFEALCALELQMDADKRSGSGMLFKTSLEKALFSSPWACIETVQNRLKRLRERYGSADFADIGKLEELLEALQSITIGEFSRYQKLLALLRSQEYAWKSKSKDDRIVIFTERLKTMEIVAQQLREDLGLNAQAVVTMDGSMDDSKLSEIVENFGREEGKVRILVATDVASEGINLHRLSHRLIHFDIPWSLMVFQQRNGRIDRYGQRQSPDIRYLFTESEVEKIKGDTRICEILVEKSRQAHDNIGDEADIMGVYDIREEELITARALETGESSEEFQAQLSAQPADDLDDLFSWDAWEEEEVAEDTDEPQLADDPGAFFSDTEYLDVAFKYFAQNEPCRCRTLESCEDREIVVGSDLERRLKAVLPPEALPQNGILKLSSDKEICLRSVLRGKQKALDQSEWPEWQYLWAQHPIFDWLSDRTGLLFQRNEAPILSALGLPAGEMVFIVSGSVANRQAVPVIEEWFALRFREGEFQEALDWRAALRRAQLEGIAPVNRASLSAAQLEQALGLREAAIGRARELLEEKAESYKQRVDEKVEDYLGELGELETKRIEALTSKRGANGAHAEQIRREVGLFFDRFEAMVSDTLRIGTGDAYLRILMVIASAE